MGLWLWSSSPSQAGVAVDGVGSYATLTEAVAAAPLGGSTLTVDAGTLVEPGSVEIPADKTPMVIEGAGPTTVVTGPTTVVRTYGDVTLRGMTLQSAANGGVRTLDDGNLVLEDLTILLDGTGSGVVTGGDSLTMTRVTIYGVPGVTTAVYGGGVDAGGTFDPIQVTLTDVRLVDTSATYSGGGIDLDNAVFTCDRCVFERTTASTGGGIHATDTAATIVRSRFCGTSAGTTGGAIAAVAEEDQWLESSLRNTLIAQSTADSGGAVYVLGGVWTLVNNHFVENTGLGAVQTLTQRAYVHLFDNLFLSNTGYAVRLGLPTAFPVMERNWMYDNGDEVWNFTDPWPGTNVVGVDPMVSGDLTDCLTAELWPTPAVSGLIDAGDPLLLDLDGTPADVGAYGGPDAGPGVDATHPKYADGDGDGFVYLADCDDADPTSFPSPETCDGADNDCDGAVDDADPDLEAPTWAPDCDGDGWGAGDGWVTGCAAPAGGCPFVDATADLDCDDQDPTAAALWIAYLDADGDELGDPASPVEACGAEPGQVAVSYTHPEPTRP
ncbi:MAG: MopE-related protein, partial [Myxococcota bacterium]